MKYKTPKKAGNELETIVKDMLIKSQIPFKQESTVSSNRQRTKGNVDFILENPVGYIECKRYTDRITVSYKSQQHDIKWSQIEFLVSRRPQSNICGFVLQETNDQKIIFVDISDFLYWWANTKNKSLTVSEVKQIGKEITDFDFICNTHI